MNYESAVRAVRRSSVAVSGVHLALMALDASVISSTLPNVYASDNAASCGSRLIVSYCGHFIWQSGICFVTATIIYMLYSGWIGLRKLTFTIVRDTGQLFLFATIFILGFLSLVFFVSAATQLKFLTDLPPLPKDFEKTHACTYRSAGFP